ncbi:glycosyltransferase [Candidatus Sulfurimonas baltica]|uniref:Glycosyltransferase n=1 Tax=Candidatus Sulfurimonas baltica TaxID=2740404 RepID=A0A7S7RMC6_9BACT|nr:glycosyltransferase [Candidatus Sulfurimonas baltica]QOY51419.1 glycosyltransferase [Candidatus Sulfurimonas baltica]
MFKIAASVVLYNPEDKIFNNIKSYANKVDKLIVIDNSTTHNLDLIKNINQSFDNLIYINNNTNIGIATALNIACDKAIELGYDWILTMDQDSEFINFNHYKTCLLNFNNTDNIALFAANTLYNAKEHLPSNPTCNYEEKFIVITSGNFLNLKLFNQIGRFEDKLFIDLVDYDYCFKAQEKNYKILYFKDVLVEHNLGSLFERRNLITKKIKIKTEHNPQRIYYFARNYLYIASKYGKKFSKEASIFKIINILFIHEVTKIIFYEDNKFKKIYAKFLGLYHFLVGKYGKHNIY